MTKDEILQAGTDYANKNWDIHNNPNEHDNAREDFIAGAMKVKSALAPVSGSYSDRDVKNIAREMENAAMYGHSHNLTRLELQEKLGKIRTKWKFRE